MDRIRFVNSLDCSSDLNEYFDEIMSMYNVINTCTDFSNKVSYNKKPDNSIMFNLHLKDYNSALKLKNDIDRVEVSNYYKQMYRLNINQNNNVLHISLHNRVSG